VLLIEAPDIEHGRTQLLPSPLWGGGAGGEGASPSPNTRHLTPDTYGASAITLTRLVRSKSRSRPDRQMPLETTSALGSTVER